jgi:hypothetical protein
VLLTAGLAVQLAPVLLLPVVLTQDGPAHVDGAWVLLHHGDDDAVGAALRTHYAVDLSPVPNMLTTLLLAGLLGVVGPDVAEKVVVSGFVVLLVAALRFALQGVDRRAGWLAVAALPLAGSRLVAYGFYNFCWGVALALLVLGVALRRRDGWSTGQAVTAALLLVLTWSAHLLPWAVAVLVVGGLAVGRWTVALRGGDRPWPAAARDLVPPALAVLPGAALSAAYLLRGGGEHGAVAGGPSPERVWSLLSMYRPLVVGSRWELVPAVAVALVLGALAVVALRRREVAPARPEPPARLAAAARADRWVLGAATVLALAGHLLTPTRLGAEYGFLPDRLAWFPPLLLVLFCATRPPRRTALQRAAAAVLVLAATAAALVRLPTQLADERRAAELLSVAGDVPPGATFAVLRFAGHQAALAPLRGEPDPLRHLSSRLAVEVGGVDLGHYEALYPYFQVRFRSDPGVRWAVDPGLDGLDAVPPWVHLDAAGDRVQYVLVVGLDRAEDWVRSAHRTAGVLADLRAGYVQVAASEASGDVTVWRLRTPADG